MITIVSQYGSIPHVHRLTFPSSAFYEGYESIVGVSYTPQPLSNYCSTRTVPFTDHLRQGKTYVANGQEFHEVFHQSIDGVITSPTISIVNNHETLRDDSYHSGAIFLTGPGLYRVPQGSSSTTNRTQVAHCAKADNGLVCTRASLSYRSSTQRSANRTVSLVTILLDAVHLYRGKCTRAQWTKSIDTRTLPDLDEESFLSYFELLCAERSATYIHSSGTSHSNYISLVDVPAKPIPEIDLRTIYSKLIPAIRNTPFYTPTKEVEKELYATCLTGQNSFTGNSIAYLADLQSLGSTVKSLLGLVSNPSDPNAWASAWLSGRFADRLTLQDTKEIFHSISSMYQRVKQHIGYQETHAVSTSVLSSTNPRYASIEILSHARLRCSSQSYSHLMTLIKRAMEWDLWPTTENMWDLIPFSFVVDWIWNLSKILSNIDNMIYEQYLRAVLYERSDKSLIRLSENFASTVLDLPSDATISNITVRCYHRYPAIRPEIGIMDGWQPTLPTPTNYIDSAALLVQLRY